MKKIYRFFLFLIILLLIYEGFKFIYFSIAYISETVTKKFYKYTLINTYMSFKARIEHIFTYTIPIFSLCSGIFTGIIYTTWKSKISDGTLDYMYFIKIQSSKYIKLLIKWILIICFLQSINYMIINAYQINIDYLFMLQIYQQGLIYFYIIGIQIFMLSMTTYLLIIYSTYILFIMIHVIIKQKKIEVSRESY